MFLLQYVISSAITIKITVHVPNTAPIIIPLLVSVLLLLSSVSMVSLVVGDMLVIDSPENQIANAQSFMISKSSNYIMHYKQLIIWRIDEADKEIRSFIDKLSLETLKSTMDIHEQLLIFFFTVHFMEYHIVSLDLGSPYL